MTEFRAAKHARSKARTIVEVWEDGVFIAAIYPAERGVRIVSKYLTDDCVPRPALEGPFPPALNVHIWDGKAGEREGE